MYTVNKTIKITSINFSYYFTNLSFANIGADRLLTAHVIGKINLMCGTKCHGTFPDYI